MYRKEKRYYRSCERCPNLVILILKHKEACKRLISSSVQCHMTNIQSRSISLLKVSQIFGHQKTWQACRIGFFVLCMQPLLIAVDLFCPIWRLITSSMGLSSSLRCLASLSVACRRWKSVFITDVNKLWSTYQYSREQGCCIEGLGTGWRKGLTAWKSTRTNAKSGT